MPSDVPIAPRRLTIRKVAPDRPWVWLNAGWRDLMTNPRIGFFYGAALAAAGWLLILLLLWVLVVVELLLRVLKCLSIKTHSVKQYLTKLRNKHATKPCKIITRLVTGVNCIRILVHN